MNSLLIAVHGLVVLADPTPAKEDVKAGWGAFFLFLALAAAVAVLGWSLVRHLRKAKENADAGVFGTDDKIE